MRRNPEFTLAGLDACWNVRYRGFMNTNSTKNDQKQLFTPETAPVAAAMPQGSKAAPRVQTAQRRQMEWVPKSLDQMVESDHPVRAVWAFVEERDLTPLYDRIKAVEGTAGKSPIDPKILFALWMYATIRGISSGRRINELCGKSGAIPFQWICGHVSVNYHTINDFRAAHPELLDQCLTESVAVLMHQGLVSLERVAQDGMRVRANASGKSFHRKPTLEECLQDAQEQVQKLKEESASADAGASSRREQAARERAARERQERVEQALVEIEEVRETKEKRKKGTGETARCSTTDPEARRMKMGDGGFRPAYNVQFATTADSRVIVGVRVTNSGKDSGEMCPMLDQIEERYGERPKEALVDGGYSTKDEIQAVESSGTKVFAPVKEEAKKRAKGVDPFAPMKGDSAEVAGWRQRMGTEEAQTIYRERAGIAEFSNAGCRNRGLQQFSLRGEAKVICEALWQALASVFQRGLNLIQTRDLNLN